MSKEFPLQSSGFHPFGELIGLVFEEVGGGTSRCVLEVREKLLNPHGVVHGGALYSMADTGMGGALYSELEEDELCTTVEIKISYFKPVTEGTLTCLTRIVSRTRRIAALESEILCDGDLVARASGTFYIFTAR